MSEDDIPIARMARETSGTIPTERDANARRIVACVNACEGIPTEILEGGFVSAVDDEKIYVAVNKRARNRKEG